MLCSGTLLQGTEQVFPERIVKRIAHHFDVVLPCFFPSIAVTIHCIELLILLTNLFLLLIIESQIAFTLASAQEFCVEKLFQAPLQFIFEPCISVDGFRVYRTHALDCFQSVYPIHIIGFFLETFDKI